MPFNENQHESPNTQRRDPLNTGSSQPFLRRTPEGLSLVQDGMVLRVDFREMLPRIKQGRLHHELLVKAAKIKQKALERDNTARLNGDSYSENARNNIRYHSDEQTAPTSMPVAIDATAGLGQDSFLLAAAGFSVYLFEQDHVIAALLRDGLKRASDDPILAPITARMHFIEGNSIAALNEYHRFLSEEVHNTSSLREGIIPEKPDVIYLDPMFPERTKSAAVKKKFQMLHRLERPCDNERELLEAAMAIRPRKVIVKRMAKGPFLAGEKPAYSIKGKSIRYDCYVFA